MQIRQANQGFNFDKYPTFEEEIDPKQRAWIEVRGKDLENNVRHLRSKLSKNCQFMAVVNCLLYTSPSPRDMSASRMPSSA